MGIKETQGSQFYSQALADFFKERRPGCFTTKTMAKWIRKRIREYEAKQKPSP